ncbi:hypothetical protein [Fangia hongkongensis]|uniref:hypothetical protein n=1 Tax=Fangia hongkongensis TaxID=270495 RepID=UPI00036863AE|nr:hypothetical protein [Fangia hongkongensis]MBK2124604.1 hypothetical protein [Fangia hongkongensis]
MKIKTIVKTVLYISAAISLSANAAVPTSGAYTTDTARTFTNSPLQKGVQQVNSIMCMVKQTEPDATENVGQGAYLANVDMNACGMGEGAESTGSQMIAVFVNSSISSGIMTADLWFDGVTVGPDGGGAQQIIQGKGTITTPPSSSVPYGVFSMDYASRNVTADQTVSSTINMQGHVGATNTSGVNEMVYVEDQEGDGTEDIQMRISKDADGVGSGRITFPAGHPGEEQQESISLFAAFNTNFLYVKGDNRELCFDRTSVTDIVYGYGLYNADGTRVSVNTGFPIRYTNDNNEVVDGWIGYYGIWLPGVSVTSALDGATVTKINMSDGTTEEGTLRYYDGRLEKNTVDSKTLSELEGVDMILSLQGGFGNSPVLQWNNDDGHFEKVGVQSCNQGSGCTIDRDANATEYDVETNVFNNSEMPSDFMPLDIPGVGFTGLNLRDYEAQSRTFNAPTSSSGIRIFTNEIQSPSSSGSTLTLYCFDNCPVQVDGTISNYNTNETVNSVKYTIELGTSGTDVYILKGPTGTVDGNNNLASVASTPTVSMTASGDSTIDIYELFATSDREGRFDETVFYSWRSSSNEWNKFITYQDSSGVLSSFDAPIKLVYTNPAGEKKFLQFEGFGRFSGIPEVCVDIGTGNEVDCYASNDGVHSENIIFKPLYNVVNTNDVDVTLTSVDEQTNYYSRQLVIAQELGVATDTTNCTTGLASEMTTAEGLTLPTIAANWTDPALGAKPTTYSSTDADNKIISS